MIGNGIPAPKSYRPATYWEDRAHRFAADGAGLGAVCSYGMPAFYNRMIHWCQRLALDPWLRVRPGTRVLDVGCGVGRWSRLLASRGAFVTGVDISPTMIAQSKLRTAEVGLTNRCRFLVQDLAALDVSGPFDLVLGVTVLQHILEPDALRAALARLTAQLSGAGRVVLLEAAPTYAATSCDTTVFRARPRHEYLQLFSESGLRVRTITGVDPAPFKKWLLPHSSKLPRPMSLAMLALATGLAAPIDAVFGRLAVERSWHAVFILEHA
jgi:SAM-dependent methyltransferase